MRTCLRAAILLALSWSGWADAAFEVPNDDCLVAACHGASAVEQRLNVHSQFNGLDGVANPAILSQHNVRYNCDGDFSTTETAANNECKKCHGTGEHHRYWRDNQWLVFPDEDTRPDPDAVTGTPVPRPVDQVPSAEAPPRTFEIFCLSCHDGRDVAPANPAMQQFSGPSGVPLPVPRVPAHDFFASRTTPFTTNPPFFNYWEGNGHGAAQANIETLPMDLTCVGPPAAVPRQANIDFGCHTWHGSRNQSLINDQTAPNGFGQGQNTMQEFAQQVCLACHPGWELATLPAPGAPRTANNDFHGGFTSGNYPSHTNPPLVAVGVTVWRARSDDQCKYYATRGWTKDPWCAGIENYSVFGSPPSPRHTIMLPFWTATDSDVLAKVYPEPLVTDAHFISCLTCHDPHGTAPTQDEFENVAINPPGAVENTRGMLRKFPTTWANPALVDPLCDECHLH